MFSVRVYVDPLAPTRVKPTLPAVTPLASVARRLRPRLARRVRSTTEPSTSGLSPSTGLRDALLTSATSATARVAVAVPRTWNSHIE